MKKTLALFFALFTALFLFVTVSAAEWDIPAAKSEYAGARGLYTLGLAQGYDTTGSNFGLTDSLTRIQAVVQVLRYLGVEEEALIAHILVKLSDL